MFGRGWQRAGMQLLVALCEKCKQRSGAVLPLVEGWWCGVCHALSRPTPPRCSGEERAATGRPAELHNKAAAVALDSCSALLFRFDVSLSAALRLLFLPLSSVITILTYCIGMGAGRVGQWHHSRLPKSNDGQPSGTQR